MNASAVKVNVAPPKGGQYGKWFCSKPHPSADQVWCRRQPDHPDECAAFVVSISTPETWYPEEEL